MWVNEEDQLRVISMQPGADVKAVFTRLVRAVNAIEGVRQSVVVHFCGRAIRTCLCRRRMLVHDSSYGTDTAEIAIDKRELPFVFLDRCRQALASLGYRFMYNEHLGYIHSCPTNCGTGLRASVHVKLPLLGRTGELKLLCEQVCVCACAVPVSY